MIWQQPMITLNNKWLRYKTTIEEEHQDCKVIIIFLCWVAYSLRGTFKSKCNTKIVGIYAPCGVQITESFKLVNYEPPTILMWFIMPQDRLNPTLPLSNGSNAQTVNSIPRFQEVLIGQEHIFFVKITETNVNLILSFSNIYRLSTMICILEISMRYFVA